MGGGKIEHEIKAFGAAISLLESRFEHAPNQYEGLRREYKTGEYGQIFVTFSRGNDNTLRDEKSTHIVMIQGARNPLSGDYFHLIKPLLEERVVDRFTVVYFPLQKKNEPYSLEPQHLVIDPMNVIYDLFDMEKRDVINNKERFFIGGLSLGADLAAFAVQQGLSKRISNYQGAILLDPACLTDVGRNSVLKDLKKYEKLINFLKIIDKGHLSRNLANFLGGAGFFLEKIHQHINRFILNKFFSDDKSVRRFLRQLEVASKADLPPNILRIVETAQESTLRLKQLFERNFAKGLERDKFPIHVAFASSAEQYRREIGEKLKTVGTVIVSENLRGSHGEARGLANIESYKKAIYQAVRVE